QRILSRSPRTFFLLNPVSRQSFLSPELSQKIKQIVDENHLAQDQTKPMDIKSFVEKLDVINLSRYRVVGNYIRYDERARNILKDFKWKILAAFDRPSIAHENYLIWAPPGSGKTFFVKQLVAVTRPTVRSYDLNLASANEEEFRVALSEVGKSSEAVLCFVDEIDGAAGESWPYEALLNDLDAHFDNGKPRVFIMAGSSGTSLAEMKAKMARRAKGNDLLSRIPHGNELQIPPLVPGDKVLLTLASLRQAGKDTGRIVIEVEKIAVYYMASRPELDSPRQLREYCVRCVERMPTGEDRVKYDNMFDAGDEISKDFWMSIKSSTPQLINSFVAIEEKD